MPSAIVPATRVVAVWSSAFTLTLPPAATSASSPIEAEVALSKLSTDTLPATPTVPEAPRLALIETTS